MKSLKARALACTITLFAGCSGETARPSPSVRPQPTVVVSPSAEPIEPTPPPPQADAIVRALYAGGDGWSTTIAGGAIWIQVDPPVDAVVRIDLATGVSTSAVPLGWRVKSSSDAVWVTCCDWSAKIDPATGRELKRIPFGGALGVADDGVWVWGDKGLIRLDPATGAPGEPVGDPATTPCEAAKDLVVAFDSAWLACKEGAVVRLDLNSGAPTLIPTKPGAHTFTVADGSVWVTNYQSASVSRIDPATNATLEIVDAGSGVGITSGGGFVWAATPSGIAKIDPATNKIVDSVDLGSGEYYELVWDEGHIWASTRGPWVLEVDPAL
jgi:streptogramin lyase